MAYKFKTVEKIVGIFVVLASIIAMVAVIFIAFGFDFFKQKYYYYTTFNDALGLKSQTPLVYKGITIARVSDVRLTRSQFFDDRTVRVEVTFEVVDTNYIYFFNEGTVVQREAPPLSQLASVMLPKISVYPGPDDAPLLFSTKKNAPALIVSTEMTEVTNVWAHYHSGEIPVSKTFDSIVSSVATILNDVANHNGPVYASLENVEAMTAKLAYGQGSLDRFLNDNNALFNNVIRNLTQFEQLLRNMARLADSLASNPIIRGQSSTRSEQSTQNNVQSIDRYEQY